MKEKENTKNEMDIGKRNEMKRNLFRKEKKRKNKTKENKLLLNKYFSKLFLFLSIRFHFYTKDKK